MAHFVDGYGSKLAGFPLINLDLVQELKPHSPDASSDKSYDCYGVNGECFGRISGYDVPREQTRVIPNTQPIRFKGFYLNEGELRSCDMPVIGWRIDSDGLTAVLPDGDVDGYGCYCLTDGIAWWIQDDAYFTDVQSCLDYAHAILLQNLKREEARKAKAAEAAATE
jgi:hypothetical protein